MAEITRNNAWTFAKMKDLIESITRDELKAHILHVSKSYRLGFTPELADQFLQEKLDDLRYSLDDGERFKYYTFVAYYLLGLVSDYTWRGWEKNKQELERWKSGKISEKREQAKEFYTETEKAGFRKAFIDYYKDQDAEKLAERVAFEWRHSEADKTKKKIDAKLQTKSHNLEKIEKLLDGEIELWRFKYYKLTEEEKVKYNEIMTSHGFTTD